MPEQSNDYRIIVFGAGSVGKLARISDDDEGEYKQSALLAAAAAARNQRDETAILTL